MTHPLYSSPPSHHPMTPAEQANLESNIRLLSTLHYVMAILTGLTALFPCIHLFLGIMLVSGNLGTSSAPSGSAVAPPAALGWFFIIFAVVFILAGLTLAILIFLNARRLAERRSHKFCMIVSGVECVLMPLGTVLGIFTILALNKPGARELFSDGPSRSATTPTPASPP
jgi:hypothetical protein